MRCVVIVTDWCMTCAVIVTDWCMRCVVIVTDWCMTCAVIVTDWCMTCDRLVYDMCCHCDRLVKNTQKMTPLPVTSLTAVKLNHKVVDFRKEKAVIRDLAYLTGSSHRVPSQASLQLAGISSSWLLIQYAALKILQITMHFLKHNIRFTEKYCHFGQLLVC